MNLCGITNLILGNLTIILFAIIFKTASAGYSYKAAVLLVITFSGIFLVQLGWIITIASRLLNSSNI